MKKFLLPLVAACVLFSVTTQEAKAQGMAVNSTGSAADASAMLDITSTTQGVLVPRMNNSQRGLISSPAAGLLIYQTDGTAGFYYNSGTSSSPVWTALGTPANATLQGNTFNGASQLVQLNASTQLPAVSGVNLTNLNASNLASGTVPIARLGSSGTASSSTYLRGDGTWSTPTSGSTSNGQLFTFSAVLPGTTPAYSGLCGTSFVGTYSYRSTTMATSGTLDALYISGTLSAGSGSNTVTITIYRNGVATALSASITVTTPVNTNIVTGSDVAHTVSFAAGDVINVVATQSNTAPTAQLSISTHMQ